MLKNFLSFCSIPDLHDKNELSVSPLGELTNKTRTYCKDPNVYQGSGMGLALINYWTRDENDKLFKIPSDLVDRQLSVCSWLFTQAKLGNLNDDQFECLQQLKNEFTKNITFTEIGEMVTNSALYLPSYIEMDFPDPSSTEETPIIIRAKIWFANEYFDTGYPYQEILIDLPVPYSDIDFLFENNYIDVAERLTKETPVVVEQRIQDLTNQFTYPYTARYSAMYLLHDELNNQTTKTYFTILIWGNPNDTDEQRLAAIADTILKHSKYNETQWTPKYPDIFNPLEFICIPHFELLGLVNKAKETSTYSPIVDYDTMLDLPKVYAPKVTEEALIKSLQVIPFMYKSAQVSFVGKMDNYNGKNKIKELFPDYQLQETDSPNAGLMEVETLNFIRDMQTLISAAETMTPTNLPVKGVLRLNRWDKFYVSKRIDKINYVMATRYQMLKDGVLDE